MLKGFKFDVSADASSPNEVAKEITAIKTAVRLILAKLPTGEQADIIQNMLNSPDPKVKGLGAMLNKFRNLHLPY